MDQSCRSAILPSGQLVAATTVRVGSADGSSLRDTQASTRQRRLGDRSRCASRARPCWRRRRCVAQTRPSCPPLHAPPHTGRVRWRSIPRCYQTCNHGTPGRARSTRAQVMPVRVVVVRPRAGTAKLQQEKMKTSPRHFRARDSSANSPQLRRFRGHAIAGRMREDGDRAGRHASLTPKPITAENRETRSLSDRRRIETLRGSTGLHGQRVSPCTGGS